MSMSTSISGLCDVQSSITCVAVSSSSNSNSSSSLDLEPPDSLLSSLSSLSLFEGGDARRFLLRDVELCSS